MSETTIFLTNDGVLVKTIIDVQFIGKKTIENKLTYNEIMPKLVGFRIVDIQPIRDGPTLKAIALTLSENGPQVNDKRHGHLIDRGLMDQGFHYIGEVSAITQKHKIYAVYEGTDRYRLRRTAPSVGRNYTLNKQTYREKIKEIVKSSGIEVRGGINWSVVLIGVAKKHINIEYDKSSRRYKRIEWFNELAKKEVYGL